jgi:alkaline phosphatase D
MTRPILAASRRHFLKTAGAAGVLSAVPGGLFMPAISRAADRPMITHGLQSGDVGADSAVIWARADRPSRMLVEVATTESFKDARLLPFVDAIDATDFAGKLVAEGLPSGQDIFYRVRFADLAEPTIVGEPVVGRFRTVPGDKRPVTFAWSGDTGGQGWGIDTDCGGMRTYATVVKHQPDFFIHSGDTIYADGPFDAEKQMPDGGVWKNITTEGTSKVAETIDEFRANWKYNMLDDNVRAFNGAMPVYYQWDDHETLNNWYPGEMLISDDRYTVKSSSLLSARANRAFLDMTPIRTDLREPGRIYRQVSYGPMLDIFFLDMRSYRGPNSRNDQMQASADTAFLGSEQVRWLKQALLGSNATWKVIAADMPIGIMVRDGDENFENGANGEGPPRGRELEMADLLRFIRDNAIKNTVWLTADVHYTAAHYYDPNKAQFQDFAPFWEFVSGPLHAGTFGPGDMDDTFGPQVMYVKAPSAEQGQNLPPSMGLQFFGLVTIDNQSEEMTVSLRDVADEELYSVTLTPERSAG